VDLEMTIWGTVAALVMFTVAGLALFVQALRSDPAERAARAASSQLPAGSGVAGPGRADFREGVRRYVGPVTPDMALLTPAKRVLLEFVGALCGFPGFGWMTSTRVSIGLPMLLIGPAMVYGFYPVYLAMSGHLADSPHVGIRYLPALAAMSAAVLAIVETRSARRRRRAD
jgi:hypothetical protein